MKIIKYLFIIFMIIFGIYFFVDIIYNDHLASERHLKEHYNGILKEIDKGERGIPDIKIDDKWIYLALPDMKITKYIKIGDSISKESGSETITVYRKDKYGVWQEKDFE